jgi:hypothetical protein
MSQVAPLLRGRSDSGAPCRAPGLRRGRIFYGVMGRSPTARSAREVRSGVAQLFIPVGRASLRREVEDASTSMTLLRGATAGSRWRGPPARRYEARSRRHSPPRSTQALSAASCPASRHPRHRGRSRRWATRRPFRARAWSARCRAPARRAPRRRRQVVLRLGEVLVDPQVIGAIGGQERVAAHPFQPVVEAIADLVVRLAENKQHAEALVVARTRRSFFAPTQDLGAAISAARTMSSWSRWR